MADTKDLKSFDENRAGSTPASRTNHMIIHTEEDLKMGQIVNDPEFAIWDKSINAYKQAAFMVMEEVTKQDYIDHVIEHYGKQYLPSPNAKLFRFFRISVD